MNGEITTITNKDYISSFNGTYAIIGDSSENS
jgi:hypothetical protein